MVNGLQGIALKNYRGIGPAFEFVAGMSRFNYFLGENNSGKSTFLNFISRHRKAISKTTGSELDPLERNLRGGQVEVLLSNKADTLGERIQNSRNLAPQQRGQMEQLIKHLSDSSGDIWFHWREPFHGPEGIYGLEDLDTLREIFGHPSEWQRLWSANTGRNGGGLDEHWIPETIAEITRHLELPTPNTRIIPAKRMLGGKGAEFQDFSGNGLVDQLARLQNPDVTDRKDREIFNKINSFVQTVLDDSTAEIEIPHDRNHILVHKNDRVLPLSSMGTGIHEVILLASFCTIATDAIICIEEPETHLHPNLQKSLVSYLRAKTNNQYFIASHSNAFLTEAQSSVYHVRLEDGGTRTKPAISPSERHSICYEMGYLPTDILQSNSCIWVEGPSDRIYLNHWISAKAPELVEGLHYSVTFYGGRLLSHLSADDDDLEKFINLRNLNRFSAILIDSDKKSARTQINATKSRIAREFSVDPGMSWVTMGREIENYIQPSLIAAAIQNIHPNIFKEADASSKYENLLTFKRKNPPGEHVADKIGVAKQVSQTPADFSVYDLNEKMNLLIEFIKNANGK